MSWTTPARCGRSCAGRAFSSPAGPASSAAGCWRVLPGPTNGWRLGAQALVLTRNLAAFAKKGAAFGRPRRYSLPHRRCARFRVSRRPVSARHSRRHGSQRQAERAESGLDAGHDRRRDAAGAGIRGASGATKFLLTSSGAVYGRQPSHLTHLGEDYAGGPDVSNPQSAYGEGKRMSELLCAIHGRASADLSRRSRAVLPLSGRTCRWTRTLPSAILFVTRWRAGRSGSMATARRIAPTFTRRTWRYGSGPSSFGARACGRYNVGSRHPLTIAEVAAAVSRSLPGNAPILVARKPVPGQPARRVRSRHGPGGE